MNKKHILGNAMERIKLIVKNNNILLDGNK